MSAPLIALALATSWCGTFAAGGAAARAVMAGMVLVLGMLGSRSWRDPLAIGGVLPAALLLCVLVSFLVSPVRRAGLEAVVLLPAFALAVAGTAHSWHDPAARRWAVRGVALLLVAGAAWSILEWGVRSAEATIAEPIRAALPLGHHNLQAAWLVALLPLASLPLRDERRRFRVAGALALLLGGVALVLSGSLAGLVAVALQLAVWLCLRLRHAERPARSVLVALLLLALAATLVAPRLVEIARFADPSLRVRLVYAEGALRGAAERPALGWGPGASRFTLGRFLPAAPGVRPPGEVVTDPHSLPLELAFDLGGSGLLLAYALVVLFFWRRLRELRADSLDRENRAAALLGLAGLALVSFSGRPSSAAAIPLTAVVLAGASLSPSASRRSVGRAWPAWLYGLLAATLLVRPSLATYSYEEARRSPGRADALLDRATRLDPGFPLYRLHRALGLAAQDPGSPEAAREAELAARTAIGLAPLWLVAGLLAHDAGEQGAAVDALLEACALDPLGALAPFVLMQTTADGQLAAARGARALLVDPVLTAAVLWDEHPSRFTETVSRVAAWPGVPPDWQGELVARLERIERRRRRGGAGGAERVLWSLEVDGRSSTALSLHAFRRPPWPFELGALELDASMAATLSALEGAGALPATDPAAFSDRLCGAPPALSERP